MDKRISPAATHALKEALSSAFWYKDDLKRFLITALGPGFAVNKLDWNDYKRNIVGDLVDALARDEARHQAVLVRLMNDVAAINDFSHLEHLDGGQVKAEKAKVAVKALRRYTTSHQIILEQQEAIARQRQLAHEKRLQTKAVSDRLEALKNEYCKLIVSIAAQQRGYALERLLRDLFDLFDLDPRASFKITGEQIDGAFTFEKTDYILEAKWQQELVGTQQLDAFSRKVERKLANTLGLFLSINGFSPDAVSLHSAHGSVMFLMDGSDLMYVLEGRIELGALLLRKRRHAAQTGEILLPVQRIFS